MNYFELYELPIQFHLDPSVIKRAFFKLSRLYHPDFHVMSSEEDQIKILEKSSLNNKAFKVLTDFDSRLKYILELEGQLEKGRTPALPPDFLMDMMDLNEGLAAAEISKERTDIGTVEMQIENRFQELELGVGDVLKREIVGFNVEDWNKVKDFYFKRQYLLRLKEKLNNLATRL